MDDQIEQAALLIERLLDEPELRAEFRTDPGPLLRRNGLAQLAPELERRLPALQTLGVRESRSSLAGVLAAVAAEGIALLDLAQAADAHPRGAGTLAVKRAAMRRGVAIGDLGRAVPASGAVPLPRARSGAHRIEPREPRADEAIRGPSGRATRDFGDRLVVPHAAAADLRDDIDPRISAVLERLTQEHRITLSVIRTGHAPFVAGTSNVSNHALGRAFDIAAVDGLPVSAGNVAAHEVAAALLRLPEDIRPSELGAPWKFDAPGSFSDGDHGDHIHVGWDDEPSQPATPAPVSEPQPERREPAAVVSGSGAVVQIRREPSEHAVRPVPTLGRQPTAGAPTPFAGLIDAAAARHGVDPNLLRGLIRAESGFDPEARSEAGALGLCQLMPATAAGLGVDPADVDENVEGGAKLLARLLARFDGNERLALAAYNAGEGNVAKYGGVPPFEETQAYVPRVLGYAAEYRGQAPAEQPGRDAVVDAGESGGSGAVAVPRSVLVESGGHALAPAPGRAVEPGGRRLVDIARDELGEREATVNDSPRIRQYRAAVQVSPPGPWCAYFVSWVARRAGHPLGDHAEGFSSVSAVWSWAEGDGKAHLPGTGYRPQPGDLILYGGNAAHIGIVERVLPDGRIQTIEGNHADRVDRVNRGAHEASGFVSMS